MKSPKNDGIAIELYLAGMNVREIERTAQIGRRRLYRLIKAKGVPKRGRGGWRPGAGRRPESEGPEELSARRHERRHERRDCAHYYGDGGCLDQAAKADKPAVPCQACHFWEWADNLAHNGDSVLWREVYLMQRGG